MVAGRAVQHGQVWEYVAGSHQYRVLVISGEDFNALDGAEPWAVVIRRAAVAIADYLVPLGSGDPIPGAVVEIPRVLRCDPSGLRTMLGFVSPGTLRQVEHGVRELLEFP